MKDEASVDEFVLFDVAGRTDQDVGFGLLVCERDGGGAIGKTADDNLVNISLCA